ncbi:hypothetical protein JG687_00018852 [Phytophthora cactorum]|uniref:Uncharacterized protein n=1 Tax=Phytophthora cactorum TaxID=29920 RepID=A0A8T1TNQ0_9STRA|nr:hypothetical protein JG687_00018852 [Phytophthora cactorum]
MLRKRGYARRGQKVASRGEFQRKPRVSLPAFIGVNGLIDYYDTVGTFDRMEFVRCCQNFAYSKRSGARPFPRSVMSQPCPHYFGLHVSACVRGSVVCLNLD